MRPLAIACAAAGVFIFAAPGCGATSSSGGNSADAATGSDGASADDGSTTHDAATSDSSSSDGAVNDAGGCALMNGSYDKTCSTATDCLMVARGCFCGAQPIIGVAKSAQPAAQTCESQNAQHCGLGCPNAPGHVAEDGQNDEGTGKNIEVRCDNGQCHTVLGT